ncbi:MAG: metalloregulator ArsR/SmtB family transcription factor [Hyphomicrobiaceae bacterium]
MNIQDLSVKSKEAASLMKALSNPHRLRILCELQLGEQSVGALEKSVGLRQSALSQHLAKLREAGIVRTRRDAQTIYYSVADRRADRLLKVMYDLFCARDSKKPSKGASK